MVMQQERKICGTLFLSGKAAEDGSGMINAIDGGNILGEVEVMVILLQEKEEEI